MNQTISVATLTTIFGLMYGSAPVLDGAFDLYVSFAPCHWHGLRPVSEV